MGPTMDWQVCRLSIGRHINEEADEENDDSTNSLHASQTTDVYATDLYLYINKTIFFCSSHTFCLFFIAFCPDI